ncbi:MAG: aldo/keto reductase [Pararhodobacter sp.]|nr:aldo/keto reductase [Pararhodobacter sp.]
MTPDASPLATLPRAQLSANGPQVARLCLGTMMFGARTDKAEAARILARYRAAGGDFIDTADTYAGGASEAMLGDLTGGDWAGLTLASKVGNPVDGVAGSGGLAPDWVAQAAAMSLERLNADRMDLYWLHKPDPQTPLPETLGALAELLRQGMITHWGLSNFRGWQVAEAVRLADTMGLPRPVAVQPYYHLLNREAEADLIPAARHYGMGIVPYSPLARGVLTGKYRTGTPEDSRAGRSDTRMMEVEFRPETLAAAARAADHAEGTGRSPAGLALNWVLACDGVTSLLAGPRTLAQLQGYLDAIAEPFAAADEAVLSALCPAGETPGGHRDPRYPLQGRATTGLATR